MWFSVMTTSFVARSRLLGEVGAVEGGHDRFVTLWRRPAAGPDQEDRVRAGPHDLLADAAQGQLTEWSAGVSLQTDKRVRSGRSLTDRRRRVAPTDHAEPCRDALLAGCLEEAERGVGVPIL